jgi:hypothetical protein
VPFEVVDRGGNEPGVLGGARRFAHRVDNVAVDSWSSMFAYQLLYELEPVARP